MSLKVARMKRKPAGWTHHGHVKSSFRSKFATYKSKGGKGHFPIFDKHSAESALHLIGHAPRSEQASIRKRADHYLHAASIDVAGKPNYPLQVVDKLEKEIKRLYDDIDAKATWLAREYKAKDLPKIKQYVKQIETNHVTALVLKEIQKLWHDVAAFGEHHVQAAH